MDVDPSSSYYRQPSNQNWSQRQQLKRSALSDRNTGPKFQRVNNISEETTSEENRGEQYCENILDYSGESTDYVIFFRVMTVKNRFLLHNIHEKNLLDKNAINKII